MECYSRVLLPLLMRSDTVQQTGSTPPTQDPLKELLGEIYTFAVFVCVFFLVDLFGSVQ